MRNTFLNLRAMLATLALSLLPGCGGPSGSEGAGDQMRPPTQVVAVPAAREIVVERLSLIGSIAANEQVEIRSEIEGTVERIGFEEGQRVEEGQLLVQLDESKYGAALAETEASFELSRANYERAKELNRDQLISLQEFDQFAATFSANEATLALRRRQLRDTKILAPFEGIVGIRLVSPGQVISRNTPLTYLVDLDPVKVEISVPERFLGTIQVGQTLDLKVAAWPDEVFTGTVFFIAPFVDPDTRTALIKARVDNPDLRLKPGMFASLELSLKVRENSIVIPEVAVNQVLEGNRANIMIVDADKKAQVRQVKIGLRLESKVEIAEGLEPGELVIVEGLQKTFPGGDVVLAPEESAAPYLSKPTAP